MKNTIFTARELTEALQLRKSDSAFRLKSMVARGHVKGERSEVDRRGTLSFDYKEAMIAVIVSHLIDMGVKDVKALQTVGYAIRNTGAKTIFYGRKCLSLFLSARGKWYFSIEDGPLVHGTQIIIWLDDARGNLKSVTQKRDL